MNPYLEIILRSVTVYLFIVIAIRLFGKKELAQLSVIDLVFILLISNSVQNAMVGPNTGLLSGIAAAATLFSINAFMKYILYNSKLFSKFVQGEPVMLIHKGTVIEKNLRGQRLTLQELEAAVREHGVERIDEVDLAVLEVDGNISIMSENFGKKSIRKRKAHKMLAKTT